MRPSSASSELAPMAKPSASAAGVISPPASRSPKRDAACAAHRDPALREARVERRFAQPELDGDSPSSSRSPSARRILSEPSTRGAATIDHSPSRARSPPACLVRPRARISQCAGKRRNSPCDASEPGVQRRSWSSSRPSPSSASSLAELEAVRREAQRRRRGEAQRILAAVHRRAQLAGPALPAPAAAQVDFEVEVGAAQRDRGFVLREAAREPGAGGLEQRSTADAQRFRDGIEAALRFLPRAGEHAARPDFPSSRGSISARLGAFSVQTSSSPGRPKAPRALARVCPSFESISACVTRWFENLARPRLSSARPLSVLSATAQRAWTSRSPPSRPVEARAAADGAFGIVAERRRIEATEGEFGAEGQRAPKLELAGAAHLAAGGRGAQAPDVDARGVAHHTRIEAHVFLRKRGVHGLRLRGSARSRAARAARCGAGRSAARASRRRSPAGWR
jgi:hypothetical protein